MRGGINQTGRWRGVEQAGRRVLWVLGRVQYRGQAGCRGASERTLMAVGIAGAPLAALAGRRWVERGAGAALARASVVSF